MTQRFDPAYLDALSRLLARPDPADLPRRAYAYRYQGDPARRATRLPPIIMAWLQRRYLEIDPEVLPAAATRSSRRPGRQANPGLRVLRRTGTD